MSGVRVTDPLAAPLRGWTSVEASAGTGKTYAITHLVLRLLVEPADAVELGEILVVTFTRAAADELARRIQQRMLLALRALRGEQGGDPVLRTWIAGLPPEVAERAEKRLAAAAGALDRASVFTIHAWCQRVLGELAFDLGGGRAEELLADERDLARRISDGWLVALVDGLPEWLADAACLGEWPRRLRSLAMRVLGGEVRVEAPCGADPDLDACAAHLEEAAAPLRAELEAIPSLTQLVEKEVDPHGQWLSVARTAEPELRTALARGWLPSKAVAERWNPANIRRKKSSTAPRHPVWPVLARYMEVVAALRDAVQRWSAFRMREFVEHTRHESERRKREAGVVGYHDLLMRLHAALAGHPAVAAAVRRRYRAVLVDEFQDTDRLQVGILERIFRDDEACVFLVGDPKQSIYGFRGADVRTYRRAVTRVDARASLDTSWRADPGLVHALARLYGSQKDPLAGSELEVRPLHPRDGAYEALSHDARRIASLELCVNPPTPAKGRSGAPRFDSVGRVVGDVRRFLDAGLRIREPGGGLRAVCPRDLAVLTRRNATAAELHARLRERGIPAVMQTDASVYSSREARELHAILAALASPFDEGLLRGAMALRWFGVHAEDLLLGEESAEWEAWTDRFRGWHEIWVADGLTAALGAMIDGAGFLPRLLVSPEGERAVANLHHLGELLHAVERERHLGPRELLAWFAQTISAEDLDYGAPEGEQLRVESEGDAVMVTTVHKAKGLEYPVVFVYGVGAAKNGGGRSSHPVYYPSEDSDGGWALETADTDDDLAKAHQERREAAETAEEARVLYVALTRARHRCSLYVPIDVRGALQRLLWPDEAGDPESRRALLDELAAASDGTITVVDPGEDDGRPWISPTPPPALRRPAPLARAVAGPWRISSASRLMASGGEHGVPVDRDAERDHDARDSEATLDEASSAQGSLGEDRSEPRWELEAGARTGTFVHAALEHHDFAAGTEALARRLGELAPAHGLLLKDPGAFARALDGVFDAVLGCGAPTLRDVTSLARRSELEFTLAVSQEQERHAFTRGSLTEAMRASGDPWLKRCADRAEVLGFPPLKGFLRGFIDLVFVHEGRVHVADFKTNDLGPPGVAYGREALEEAMLEHHYGVQALLYAVAVCRFFRTATEGFDIDRNFGGLHYLFLRGMQPGTTQGVFSFRPPTATLVALDEALGGSP